MVVCEREVFEDVLAVELVALLCPVTVTITVTITGWAVTVTNTVCVLSRVLEESAGSKAAPVSCASA